MKKVLLIILISAVGCKENPNPKQNPASPEANYNVVYANVKQYLMSNINNAVSIDSLVFYSDSLSMKKINSRKSTMYLSNSLSWGWYKPGKYDDLLHLPIYTMEEAAKQEDRYKKEYNKYLLKSRISDSVRLIAWNVYINGLLTTNDGVQNEFRGVVYLTAKDFKIIDPKVLFGDILSPYSSYDRFEISVSPYNPAKGLILFDTSYLDEENLPDSMINLIGY